MKFIDLWKKTLVVSVLLLVVIPLPGRAGMLASDSPSLIERASPPEVQQLLDKHCREITSRPLSDFLSAQGNSNKPPQFFPPVRDYVGWTDSVDPETQFPTIFALVDYAGLADKYIKKQTGHSLGTKVTGFVVECKRTDGKAQISLALFTTRALGFAQSFADLAENGFNFLSTPTIFGSTANAIVGTKSNPGQADPAVGPATLFTTFSIEKPGASLPDFLDVVNKPARYAPVKFNFVSKTFGECSDGRKARLVVHQSAATNNEDVLVFSNELVQTVAGGSGTCLDPQ